MNEFLPMVYGPLTEVLVPPSSISSTINPPQETSEASISAGEEDLRCAACNALLELPRKLLLEHGKSIGAPPLVDEVWRLLERSAGEQSSATGPLLTLATELIIS